MLDHAIYRAHGTTGAMITSGVTFVLATVAVIFFVATSAQPPANAEFRARLDAEHATVCERLGRVPGTSEHAGCMNQLIRLDACLAQDL